MKKYGLIGKKLSHSWSAKWFGEKFEKEGIADAEYRLYELDGVADLRAWVERNGLKGFNVTIPYKEAVLEWMDELDETARGVGAVNCVDCRGGRLKGYNTDAPAFAETLRPLLQPWHKRALVLGTGGAAKAVAFALKGLGIEYKFVSRKPVGESVGYDEAMELAATHLLIVNATPVGMYPATEASPWPEPQRIGERHLCYDLIYNPQETLFLRQAKQAGATVCGGLKMLQRQAELSWMVWNPATEEE